MRELLSHTGSAIIFISAVIAASTAIAVMAAKAFHWYVQKFKRQNRSWHGFLIKELYEKSFQPYFIIESKKLECTFTNTALRRLFVSGSENFDGKNWFRLIDPADLPDVIRAWRDAFDNRSSYTNITSMILPDGTKLTMEVTGEPFIYAGKTRAFIGRVRVVK